MDLENLTGLLAIAHRFHSLDREEGLSAAERSNVRQALGIEVEERALRLVAEVRRARGFGGFDEEDAGKLVPEVEPTVSVNGHHVNGHDEEEEEPPDLDGPFNAAKVRDLMLRYKDGFIIPELAAELDAEYGEVKKYVLIWAKAGQVGPTGFKIGRHVQYEYIKPQPGPPVNREKRTPVERTVAPAFTESRANGKAVRVPAMSKLTRKGRSTGGVAHHHRMRDQRYEEMQKAVEKRAAEQRGKAEQARQQAAGGKKKGR